MRISFKNIRKEEIPEIVNSILVIVLKNDPKELKIVGMYEKLFELRHQLNALAIKYEGYSVSDDLKADCKRLQKLLKAIFAQIISIEFAKVPSNAHHASLAIPFLKSYLNGIIKQGQYAQSGKINQLLLNLEGNTAMNDALSSLGLSVYVNELRVCQENINAGYAKFNQSKSTSILSETQNIRDKIETSINNLFVGIYLAQIENPEIDYTLMIRDLKVSLSSQQSIVKSRVTRSANNKSKTVDQSTTTQSTAI